VISRPGKVIEMSIMNMNFKVMSNSNIFSFKKKIIKKMEMHHTLVIEGMQQFLAFLELLNDFRHKQKSGQRHSSAFYLGRK